MEAITCTACGHVYNGTPATPCPACGHRPAAAASTALPATMPQTTPAMRAPKRKKKSAATPRRTLYTRIAIAALLVLAAGEYFLVAGIYRNQAYDERLALWNTGTSVSKNRRKPDPVYQIVQPELPPDTTLERLLYEDEMAIDSTLPETDTGAEIQEDVESFFN